MDEKERTSGKVHHTGIAIETTGPRGTSNDATRCLKGCGEVRVPDE